MSAVRGIRYLDYCADTRVTRDVVYGQARVGYLDGEKAFRELRLDVYEPAYRDGAGCSEPRPALLLAFGGAFHRGSKEDDSYRVGDHFNTPVAEYCRAFARRGYVAFSIDYRLAQEDPAAGDTPVVGSPETIPRSRVNYVREVLGLPPITTDLLWRCVEAASDDFAMAFDFVHDNASRWEIDTRRIAVGGFSAGARSALNVAFGERRPVGAVVSLSGFMSPDDLEREIALKRASVPIMLVAGEHDLDYVEDNFATMAAHLERAGVRYEAYKIPKATHFYPAQCLVSRAGRAPLSLEIAIARFLYDSLGLSARPMAA